VKRKRLWERERERGVVGNRVRERGCGKESVRERLWERE